MRALARRPGTRQTGQPAGGRTARALGRQRTARGFCGAAESVQYGAFFALDRSRDSRCPTLHALVLEQLRKVYANGVEALSGIDLTVQEGDFFALLGPNGAGKTTAIGIVTSLVNKTGGRVSVFGHDLDTAREAAKACIGVVPQEANLNLFEKNRNILINQAGYYGVPRPLARRRAEKYLRALHLWDRRDDIARNLSGGMKRRLMIARALVHEPRLLILDEPTAGVDIEIRRSMWELMREINRTGMTIILTTHYLEEAESLCRNIAIIDEGRIIENDTMVSVVSQLQREVFVLSLCEPVREGLALDGYRVRVRNEHEIEVEVTKEQGLNGLFEAISAQALQVASMRTRANRLEELFMRLVESKTGESAGAAAARSAQERDARVEPRR
ncbi:MAG: ABC transporter ATP-binding protein [Rhodospirillaceae bacterium]|nr:ABC transporter ATP-binding protein [Rhodospirillaceae bacterium]